MNKNEIKDIVYKHLIGLFQDTEEFKIRMSQFPEDGIDRQLYTEIELDSLDIIIFITNLEKEFNIRLKDSLFKDDCTCRDIINYIDKKING